MANKKKKNPAAEALGRLGGKKTAKKLRTKQARRQKGKDLAAARWNKAKQKKTTR